MKLITAPWESIAREFGCVEVDLHHAPFLRMAEEIARLRSELDSLAFEKSGVKRYEDFKNSLTFHRDLNEMLKEELALSKSNEAMLRAALEFYADEDTYHAIGFILDPPCGDFAGDVNESGGKPGACARKALSQSPTSALEVIREAMGQMDLITKDLDKVIQPEKSLLKLKQALGALSAQFGGCDG